MTSPGTAEITRALNAVASVAQMRAAIDLALAHAEAGARVLLPEIASEQRKSATNAINARIAALVAERSKFRADDRSPVRPEEKERARYHVQGAFIEVESLEGLADSAPSLTSEIGAAFKEVVNDPSLVVKRTIENIVKPAVKTAGEVVGVAAKGVGDAAGGLGGGLLKGLGFSGLVYVAIAVGAYALVRKLA